MGSVVQENNMKEELVKKIGEVVLELGVKEPKVVLDYPTYSELGDFTTNIAMVHAKELGKKPIDLANEIKDKIENSGLGSISKINVINPGFINFFISPKYFAEALGQKNYGSLFSGQKVFFEHSQPNPFKAFHIGHLMGNCS
jgi:arginyl-tRNA synthetase